MTLFRLNSHVPLMQEILLKIAGEPLVQALKTFTFKSNFPQHWTGLQVSKSKVAKSHIDGANKQAISTVGKSEAVQPNSLPNVTDDTMEQLNKADNVHVDVLLDHDPDLSNWPYPDKAADSYSV